MHRRLLLFIVSSLLFSPVVAQVSIAPYYGGHQAALSLTFDDGLEDQYTLAWPELKKRGLRATFAIIGSKVGGIMQSKQDRIDGTNGTPTMTWDMLRELATRPIEEVKDEVQAIKAAFFALRREEVAKEKEEFLANGNTRLQFGQCSGCNTSLPSAILSKIRNGALVECETCGRMIIQ